MNKLSWRAKLTGLTTLILGTLLLFQLLYVIPYTRNREVEMTQAHQEEIARSIARELDIDLERIGNRLVRMAERVEFRDMDIAAQESTMAQHVETSLFLSSLLVMDAEGWFVSGTVDDFPAYTTKSYADRPYFAVPFERGQVYFALPRFYPGEKLVGASVNVPIQSDTGERVGVLMGGMILNEMIERVEHYPLEEGTVTYLVDTEGTLVAHSGIDLFALEEGPLSLDYSDRPLVRAIMAGEMAGSEEHDHEGAFCSGAYATLESNGWGVVVETPMSVILAEPNELSRRLLAANMVPFVIASAVALVFTRQITGEQRQAEAALRQERDFAESLIDTAQTIVLVLDTESRIVRFNPYMEELSGYRLAEVQGKDWFSTFLPMRDHARIRELLQEATDGIQTRGNVNPILTKDGHEREIEWNDKTLKDADGNAVGLLAIGQDITERKRAEEALHRRAEELTTLQATVLDITAPHDLPTLLHDIVERAAHLLGAQGGGMYLCDSDQEQVRCVVSYQTPSDYTGTMLKYGEGAAGTVAQTGEPLIIDNYRTWARRALVYEEEQPFSTVLSAPMMWQGQVTGVIHVLDDVETRRFTQADLELLTLFANHAAIAVENAEMVEQVQRHAAELEQRVDERTQELRDAQEQLVRREKLAVLGQLAGGVAHDLRNPLAAIKNAAYFLNMVLEEPEPEVKEALEIVDKELGTSERIISGLLDFARTKPPTRREVDVNDLVADALPHADVLDLPAQAGNVEVVWQLEEALPVLLADPDQLVRVFGNLMLNAVQAMPDGGTLTVRTALDRGMGGERDTGTGRQGDYLPISPSPSLRVSISDTGVGIPEENMGNLFEPLFSTKAQGIGLGLALCKTLAEANGGSIEVESEVGKGSTFTVKLPAREA